MNNTNNNYAVFVTNIAYNAKFEHIKYYMEQVGKVTYVKVTHNNHAYVYYTRFSDAIRAVEELDRSKFFGRNIYVTTHKDNEFLRKAYPDRGERPFKRMKSSTSANSSDSIEETTTTQSRFREEHQKEDDDDEQDLY